jgi:hypothetical protein
MIATPTNQRRWPTGGWIECEPVDRPSGCSDPREKLVSLLPLGPKLAGGLPA